jgi:hypothetical protein
MPDIFDDKKFDVEHALNMYASSFVIMPAFGIYDEEILKRYESQIPSCHIYLIGLVPKVDFVGAKQDGNALVTYFEVLGERHDIRWPMEAGMSLVGGPESGWYVIDEAGRKSFPHQDTMMARLSNEKGAVNFEVLYIGQAFGENGSRSALDRLKKHETLQKIAVQGVPDGFTLTLLMLEIVPANRMFMMFNPWAQDNEHGDERISNGLDKLFNTNEAERTTLYEASLIRYFKPRFNKEVKNSFPSTNLKILSDCYDKDIAAVIAEICFDVLPFRLFTDAVEPKIYHIAHHDLHDDAARKVFFT